MSGALNFTTGPVAAPQVPCSVIAALLTSRATRGPFPRLWLGNTEERKRLGDSISRRGNCAVFAALAAETPPGQSGPNVKLSFRSYLIPHTEQTPRDSGAFVVRDTRSRSSQCPLPPSSVSGGFNSPCSASCCLGTLNLRMTDLAVTRRSHRTQRIGWAVG